MAAGAEFEQRFTVRLEEEHVLLHELLGSLEQMKSALIEGSAIESILHEKEQLLLRLEKCTALRLQVLQEHGILPGKDRVAELLAAHGCSAALIDKYRGFEQTVAACQQQNQALGRLAKRRENFVNRALDALGSPSSSSTTYSPAGGNPGSSSARLLGSA